MTQAPYQVITSLLERQYTVQEIAETLGLNRTTVTRRAANEGWSFEEEPHAGQSRRLYTLSRLPDPIQYAILTRNPEFQEATHKPLNYDPEQLWYRWDQTPNKMKSRAEVAVDAINHALSLIGSGKPKTLAWEEAAKQAGVDRATLYRWYERVLPYHKTDWLAASLPNYNGNRSTGACSSAAWDFIKSDYLRAEAPGVAACYQRLKRAAAENNWTIQSLSTFERRLKKIPIRVRRLAREGKETLTGLYPAQERAHEVFNAMEAVNADGHTFDVFVKWPDGEERRPVMVAFQDIYSGKLVSWRIDKTENSDAVRLAFGDCVEKYGIPKHTYLDNGRGFASKWLTGGVPNRYRFTIKSEEPVGLFPRLGVEVHWCTPYHGQAKPIERAFRDLCEYVAKHPAFSGAYTGNNPTAKPENYGSKAIPLDAFLEILEQEIIAHNARTGRRSEVADGRSFDEVFTASYETSTINKATTDQRRLWLLAAESVHVKADATVALHVDRRNRYYTEALYEHAGERVVVRFDPQRLHDLVHVYTLGGLYVGEAACIEAVGFNDTQAAREHARARNAFKRATREQLEAERRMSPAQVADLLPKLEQPAAPDARIVRPFYPAEQLRDPAPQPELTEEQQAEVARFQERFAAEQQKVVDEEPEMPMARYERWLAIDEAIRQGETATDADRIYWERYPRSDEYRSMRGFRADFPEFYPETGATGA